MESQRRGMTKAFCVALFSQLIALYYFSSFSQMAATGLCALALSSLMQQYLDQNRDAIWRDRISPWNANELLARQILYLFLGVFLASMCLELALRYWQLSPNSSSFRYLGQGLKQLLLHNYAIMVAGTILAVAYRAGGFMLVLAWNAINWSFIIAASLFAISKQADFVSSALMALSILPHLIFEALAYVIAGMSGVFLSSAFRRYKLASPEFFRVSLACLMLFLVAIAALTLAAILETTLAAKASNSLARMY